MLSRFPAAVPSLSILLVASGAALPGSSNRAHEGDESPEPPSWIWSDADGSDARVTFERSFELAEVPGRMTLTGTCDNRMTVKLNGEVVSEHRRWEQVVRVDVAGVLVEGRNVLEVSAQNEGGPAGLALRLAGRGLPPLVTDASWRARVDGGEWQGAHVLGRVGDADLPWTATVDRSHFGLLSDDDRRVRTQAPTPAEGIHLLDGFEAELVYSVPRGDQGSWVALAKDPSGRLYASDQGGKGLYRIVPAALSGDGAETTVERIEVGVSGAQGMCWAFDSLYVNVNGQGLWRIQDTDGDDRLDSAENLVPLGHGGEHGPHAVLPTPDGEGLFFIAGNHTDAPPFVGSRIPANWGEDLLLPRQWDARGHARGKLAPGGWIARCDPNGENVEILSIGYRNQYDIALDHHGEMFTYDADMEWDIGLPWYRPTRVCHVTSGSEFGWRSGTGKWPTYYEDSLPPVVEIGPGSPTGILFGHGASFPAKYQRALFILDWTFGTIYAVHLEPSGASFTGSKEDFAWSKPLAVTDAVVGDDGALYFAVGGRGAESALYRIVYRGSESTAPARAEEGEVTVRARARRRVLEALHGRADANALDLAWPALESDDRHLRYAARVALEAQPVATWRDRALAERGAWAAPTVLIGLARQGRPADLGPVVDALIGLEFDDRSEAQQLAILRGLALAFIRLREPDSELEPGLRGRVVDALEARFPVGRDTLDTELARLLTYLGSEAAVERGLALMTREPSNELPPWAELIERNDTYGGPIAKMLANMPPQREIGYALILRNATAGWTPERREEYFRFFLSASQHPGGNSYAGFLDNIRAEAAETLTVAERRVLAELLEEPLVVPVPIDVKPPEGPGRAWTLAEAREVVGPAPKGRDFDRGRNLFHATSCSACHRFDGEGGAIGPDLTTVANKFSVADLLEAIVEPSAVISDQYGAHILRTTEGEIVEGIVVDDGVEVAVYPRDPAEEPFVIDKSEVDVMRPSTLSQMPDGLVDALSPDELRDLVGYLLSGGNRRAPSVRAD